MTGEAVKKQPVKNGGFREWDPPLTFSVHFACGILFAKKVNAPATSHPQEIVDFEAAIPCIRYGILWIKSISFMEAIHQRLETIHIGSICIHAVVGYHFVTDHHLQIYPGKSWSFFMWSFLNRMKVASWSVLE